jgi:small subunit ribosomal protein S20
VTGFRERTKKRWKRRQEKQEHPSVANIKSQVKRNRTNEVRRVRNQAVRSELKTRVKLARQAIGGGGEDMADVVVRAQKHLDKAAARGRIHKRQAARRVSRLMRQAASSSR